MGLNSPVYSSDYKQLVSVSSADVGPAQEQPQKLYREPRRYPCQSYVNVTVHWVHPITAEIIETCCPIPLSKMQKQCYDSDRQKHKLY